MVYMVKDIPVSKMIARLHKIMSYEAIAVEMHCSRTSVVYWEQGKRNPNFNTFQAIAVLYHSKMK